MLKFQVEESAKLFFNPIAQSDRSGVYGEARSLPEYVGPNGGLVYLNERRRAIGFEEDGDVRGGA